MFERRYLLRRPCGNTVLNKYVRMRLICQNNECNTMDCKLRDTTFRKQSIKKVSIPLNKFNDVAVPHHVEMLKKHKGNIQKFQLMGDWNKVHHEQINAARVIRQLKHLLYEMDVLRNQVQNSDLIDFDKLTDNSRRHAQDAIKEYFGKLDMTMIVQTYLFYDI
ncbi:hypothetical protein C0J52_26363 [Blattella germanica]|nr:hypothetical protein C0J52_26363 [Blattella germanica]